MKYDEIKKVISELAKFQGFYGRLLSQIEELEQNDEEGFENLVNVLENQNFHDSLDVVMFFEG